MRQSLEMPRRVREMRAPREARRSLGRLFLCAAMILAVSVGGERTAVAQSAHDAIGEVQRRMVKIFGAGGLRRLQGYGSGFLVSPEGHVATVWSHVLDSEVVSVVLHDGRKFAARVIGADPELDVAVLKLEGDDLALPFFDLSQTARGSVGTRVLAFSNMFKVATGDEPVSVLHGVISAQITLSARRGAFEVPYRGEVYVVDAITNNAGAAGGALTTRDGRLLGMIGKELRNSESNTWINYSVPITALRDAIQNMIAGTHDAGSRSRDDEQRPRYRPLDFGLVMIPDVVQRTPAYVVSVLKASPAEAAGVRPDDLILFVNDNLVQSCRELVDEIGRLEQGDPLRITLRRGDELVSLEMRVDRQGRAP